MTTVFSMTACILCCHSQNRSIGIDILSSLCFESPGIRISYGITQKWSAGADAYIDLNVMKRREDELMSAHKEGLSPLSAVRTETEMISGGFQGIGFHLDYWPEKIFKGCFISVGGKVLDRHGPDMTLGIGYSFPIWKGVGAEASYRFGVSEAYKDGKRPLKGIKAEIYYVF